MPRQKKSGQPVLMTPEQALDERLKSVKERDRGTPRIYEKVSRNEQTNGEFKRPILREITPRSKPGSRGINQQDEPPTKSGVEG